MKLVFLGTAGYHPTDHRQTMCIMLPEQGIMLDAGSGMYRTADYLETSELDIFLTHTHLDHVIGLTYLFDVTRVRPLRRVTLHGIAAKLKAIETHLFHNDLFPKLPPMEFQPLAEGETPLGGQGRLSWFPVSHPGGAIAYRLDWPDRALAYVTDTTATPAAAYAEHVRGVDLLVHECHLSDAQAASAEATGHSHTSAVAELARRVGAGRLLLTHINPLAPDEDPVGLAAARSIFPATVIARDRMTVEF
jgi:ribonuclease Z